MKAQKYLVVEIRTPLPEGVLGAASVVARCDTIIETFRREAEEEFGQNGFEINVRIAQPRGPQQKTPSEPAENVRGVLRSVLADDDAA